MTTISQTTSSWIATSQIPVNSTPARNLRTEIGLAGVDLARLITAYLLARQGKKVAVIEANKIGGGQTEPTTAHLITVLDGHYHEIEKLRDESWFRLTAQSHIDL